MTRDEIVESCKISLGGTRDVAGQLLNISGRLDRACRTARTKSSTPTMLDRLTGDLDIVETGLVAAIAGLQAELDRVNRAHVAARSLARGAALDAWEAARRGDVAP